jgi:hypothetical protein
VKSLGLKRLYLTAGFFAAGFLAAGFFATAFGATALAGAVFGVTAFAEVSTDRIAPFKNEIFTPGVVSMIARSPSIETTVPVIPL